MLSYWEDILNKKSKGVTGLNLTTILETIGNDRDVFELNKEFNTIQYIPAEKFEHDVFEYVEPEFYEADTTTNKIPRFIIFSAPGATGKTALAMNICYHKNGIYWNLPNNRVAEFSLQGAIQTAVGTEHLSDFYKSITAGRNLLVIDAFDEAEAGSGRTGIEFFLRDLNTITKDSTHTCAILMARTESALFIKNYFINNGIPFAHYEVGFFSEMRAKDYIRNRLRKLHVSYTDIVDECVDQQFAEIKRIFTMDDAKAFIGYAPVLDALAAAYDDDRNTLNLLKSTVKGENNCDLINKILSKLLTREREKLLNALTVKVSSVNSQAVLNNVYTQREQFYRILGKVLLNDATAFMNTPDGFPIEHEEEYFELVNTQLPQHPFIQTEEVDNSTVYDFTGAAFRDYVLAYTLADSDLSDFVTDYLNTHAKFCPSQMMIEFYGMFSGNKVSGRYLPMMYNSFRSSARLGDKIVVNINGDADDCSAEFSLVRDEVTVRVIEFKITDFEKGIYLEQVSGCYIDVAGKVCVGSIDEEARISNSTISCDTLEWHSRNIAIEAFTPGECSLSFERMNCTTETLPHFEIKTDDRKNLKIFANQKSLSGYFKLLAYRADNDAEEDDGTFTPFANLVRRVFSCLRSHSKDTMARKRDFIDNRIVSKSESKQKILDFLLHEGVLYVDDQDWLYKLDTTKVAENCINWNKVREGDYSTLKVLYKKFCNSNKSDTEIARLNAF